MHYFWPIVTGLTFFDIWTVVHLAFWVATSSYLWSFRDKIKKLWAFVICFSFSFIWEVIERIAETYWADRWTSPESWVNSWISDPLMCVISFFTMWALMDKYGERKNG